MKNGMAGMLARAIGAGAVAVALAAPANAAVITFVDLGTAAGPSTLGPYNMALFPKDSRADFTDVATVPAPGGGSLAFSQLMDVRTVGVDWATWSGGYTGSVYYDNGSDGGALGMALPGGTRAFYFYAEPNDFSTFTFTALGVDGSAIASSGPIAISGLGGAHGFGFYTDGSSIGGVSISGTTGDYAVGEFAIATPEPTSMLLLATGLLGLARRKFRR